MINDENTDVAEVMETFLRHLKKWLPPREYTRCVWLLDQQRFAELYLYVARRNDVASQAVARIKCEAVKGVLVGPLLHLKRYYAAVRNHGRAVKALITLRRYIWAKFGLEAVLDVMADWEYRNAG